MEWWEQDGLQSLLLFVKLAYQIVLSCQSVLLIICLCGNFISNDFIVFLEANQNKLTKIS